MASLQKAALLRTGLAWKNFALFYGAPSPQLLTPQWILYYAFAGLYDTRRFKSSYRRSIYNHAAPSSASPAF